MTALTLSDDMYDLVGDFARALRLNLPKLLAMTHIEDLEKLA